MYSQTVFLRTVTGPFSDVWPYG